ncbi:MAG: DUF669 domain-containing protein [Ruminococcus sp.]|nr:DUF669 domain-containing protein [Ruminococcus sp.]
MSDKFMDRALEWDDEIENESSYTIVPEGIYDFEVTKFERGTHNGSEKLPPCKKAILTIRVTNGKESTTIVHTLFLHSKCESMLSAFFLAIGEKKHGEKVRMNWSAVTGAKGKCKVYIDNYKGEQYNKIKSFLAPEKAATAETKYGGF